MSLNITYETQDVTAMLCFWEIYNELGYYKNNRVNPYLYSGTNVYISGKYIADDVCDPNAVDNQVGGYYSFTCAVKQTRSTYENKIFYRVDIIHSIYYRRMRAK